MKVSTWLPTSEPLSPECVVVCVGGQQPVSLWREQGLLFVGSWIETTQPKCHSLGLRNLLWDELTSIKGFPGGSVGEGNGTPLQYSCLENRMDGGAW